MGLRINHNISAMTALRNLRINDKMQQRSLERLSTGSRINRASDDPSGLVISERLRAQIAGLEQAVENSQNASNLIGTAEAALQEVATLLVGIRDSALFAINSGGSSPEQIAAEQDAVDNTISAIDRIANTTRFGTRQLLNGVSGFSVLSRSAGISELTLRNIQFAGASQVTFDVNVTDSATRADLTSFTYLGAGASPAVIRIVGSLGVQDLAVASAASVVEFNSAVNAMKWNTGVYASAGDLYSIEYGSSETISLEVVSGTFNEQTGGLDSTDGVKLDSGSDIQGTLEGTPFTSIGNRATMVSNFFTGEILFADGTGADQTFTVLESGLTFQISGGTSLNDRETVGIFAVNPSYLGAPIKSIAGDTINGYLTSLMAGGSNDMFSDPVNALRIVDNAIDDVSDMRAFLGAFQSFTIDTNVSSLDVAIENLTASESWIRDLDFAEETANYTRSQILFQAGTAVMAQANLIPQSILTLLQ